MKMTLNEYFSKHWYPNYTNFIYSGYKLINKVGDHETILDVGCGYNLFKTSFHDRIHGIDPANKDADELVSIEEFESDKQWDVLFILGSINFGDKETIKKQIKKSLTFLRDGGRIYWRQNPGVGDHPWKGVEDIEFFPWTINLNYEFAKEFGCEVVECKWDNSNRIYSEWRKCDQ